MKSKPFICSLTMVLLCAPIASASDFEPLFNGKNLDNWVRTNTPEDTWTAQGGLLICSGQPFGEIRTQEMFQNFVLDVEWRHLVPKGNAGIFVWADDLPSRGVPFHRGIEVQVLELGAGASPYHTSDGDIFPIHGATMDPDNGRGGSRAFPTEARVKPGPEWNHFRITCDDGTITLAVNGKVVTSGRNATPRKGYICLESEGGVVHYRNIRIKRLPDTPVTDDQTAIADRGYRSVYTGLNLSGWRIDKRLADHVKEADGWMVDDWKLRHRAIGPARRLRCDLAGQTGYICDFRLVNKMSTGRFFLLGEENPAGIVDLSDASVAAALAKTGGWNRLEYELRDGQLLVNLNGKSIRRVDVGAEQATLILEATGALDYANLFARSGK